MMMQLAAPSRGSIHDRTGAVLAEDRENLRLLVLPAFCKSLPETLDELSQHRPHFRGPHATASSGPPLVRAVTIPCSWPKG